MYAKHGPIVLLALLIALLGSAVAAAGYASPTAAAYVEPALFAARTPSVAIIVAARDSRSAARAVERLGGQITSDLWLIDSVAALLPTPQLTALASTPGIRSIVANGRVKSSESGWVTEIRVRKASHTLLSTQNTPVTYLPDGGFVSVSETGNILIVNADGSEQARVNLPGSPYRTLAVVDASGTIFVGSETKHIFALDSRGAIRWHFSDTNGAKFLGGVALGSGGVLYAADTSGIVYALDSATGRTRWVYKASGAGVILTTPIVGPDGTLYFDTDKGYVYALNPDGSRRWVYNTAQPLKLNPLLGPNGTIYVASTDGKKLFALDAAAGVVKFIFTAASKLIAQPQLGPDASVYLAAEDRSLYGLNPNGSQRFLFRPASGHFRTTPALSADGTTLYAALEEKILFAVDASSGLERWRYTMLGNIKARPVLDADGGVIVGSEGMDLVRLNADGAVTFSASMVDKVTQAAQSAPSGDATVRVGSAQLVTIGRLPDHWDGRPDVRATDNRRVWRLVNPVAIDVGADRLHAARLPSGQVIQGSGVTVAVVDSGVYFDRDVKSELGTAVQKLFRGQADFVESTCRTTTQSGRLVTIGVQNNGYCALGWEHSVDGYGHGSHVAGIIWNNFSDADTGVKLGVAPDASILSVRVLDDDGVGSYETVINGIQYVVDHRAAFNTRVMNLSLSAYATTPYFVDPLNRAVERAWASGIVVLAAAGNTGPAAESITVPGNDPYVITVGALNSNRTPGYWADDILPAWSATGPTADGFAKPDILAPGSNIISFMYNDPTSIANSPKLVRLHPDYTATTSLFRMSGTSMSTAVASGVVALMLQVHPWLTPDQVKYRLLESARPALTAEDGDLTYNVFQQGMGRIWAPDAVWGDFAASGTGNPGMYLDADLAHGWETDEDLAYHYQGPVRKLLSDDGQAYLYYVEDENAAVTGLGVAWADSATWVDRDALASARMSWAGARMSWAGGMTWAGGMSATAGQTSWAGARMSWAGARMSWAGARMSWAGARMSWAGARMSWAGARMSWAGSLSGSSGLSATTWVGDW